MGQVLISIFSKTFLKKAKDKGLEFPPRRVSCKRDYISWWLNCRPTYVDESVSGYLKQRVQFYHTIGEIEKAFRYSRFGLELSPDCLFMWHDMLGVSYDTKLLNLIPNNTDGYVEVATITIMFNGFNNLPYTSFNLKLRSFIDFQYLLDYIFGCIFLSLPKSDVLKVWGNLYLVDPFFFDHFKRRSGKYNIFQETMRIGF